MHELGIHSGADPTWLRMTLKADLAKLGLYRMDEEIARSLLEQKGSRDWIRHIHVYQKEWADSFWRAVFKSPQRIASLVIDFLEERRGDNLLSDLILAIERNPPDEEVIQAVWDALKVRSYAGENRHEVFGALFRLSHLVSENERSSMRREYMDLITARTMGIDADNWRYRRTALYYLMISGASEPSATGYDPNPLAHPGGGNGIPWEDDELSARFSWKTMVNRQLYRDPMLDPSSRGREVFAQLVHGFDGEYQITAWKRPPRISAPFPRTPWQKARALHQRRPDLEFK